MFRNICEKNKYLNDTFSLKLAKISLQKHKFMWMSLMRFTNFKFCPCMDITKIKHWEWDLCGLFWIFNQSFYFSYLSLQSPWWHCILCWWFCLPHSVHGWWTLGSWSQHKGRLDYRQCPQIGLQYGIKNKAANCFTM